MRVVTGAGWAMSAVVGAALLVIGFAVGYATSVVLDGHAMGDPATDAQTARAAASSDVERPLKGPIPDDVTIPEPGQAADPRMPRYVPVWDRAGQRIAGYVDHDQLMKDESSGANTPTPVLDEALDARVGHLVPGIGFVPTGVSATDLEPLPGLTLEFDTEAELLDAIRSGALERTE